jgi:hypothetical protein
MRSAFAPLVFPHSCGSGQPLRGTWLFEISFGSGYHIAFCFALEWLGFFLLM